MLQKITYGMETQPKIRNVNHGNAALQPGSRIFRKEGINLSRKCACGGSLGIALFSVVSQNVLGFLSDSV